MDLKAPSCGQLDSASGTAGRSNRAERIPAVALVFRFTGCLPPIRMRSGVFDGEQSVVILRHRNGASRRGSLVAKEKPIPNISCDDQKHDEHDEFFLLLHEAVRKYVLRCRVTLMVPDGP